MWSGAEGDDAESTSFRAGMKRGQDSLAAPSQPAKRTKGGSDVGEVRFEDALAAKQALFLDGTILHGTEISVVADERSKDGTKIMVHGLPHGVEWQELKEHFACCGTVAYANVNRKGGGKGRSNAPAIGQVRFETGDEAQKALMLLNGSKLGDYDIQIKIHAGSKDGTKLQVHNLPPGLDWQELKDHFAQAGTVAFAEVTQVHPGVQLCGEVRFENAEDARTAMKSLNGSTVGGSQIYIQPDPRSQDGAKLIVHGVPAGIEWQELKDHFAPIGEVAFCQIRQPPQNNGFMMGKGKTGGGKCWGSYAGFGGCGGFGNFGGFSGFGSCGGYKGKGSKGGKGFGGPPHSRHGVTGEVRYMNPGHAHMAISMLHGSTLKGYPIVVDTDWQSQDGSKLWISGLSPDTAWQDLKDHFSWVGPVAYAQVGKRK